VVLIGGAIALILLLGKGSDEKGGKKGSSGDQAKIPDDKLPNWKPDPAMLKDLNEELTIQDFRIRPPKGSKVGRTGRRADPNFYPLEFNGPNGKRNYLVIYFIKPKSQKASRTEVEEHLVDFQKSRRGKPVHPFDPTTTEWGKINGLIAARFRWSEPDHEEKQKKNYGICYMVTDGKVILRIYCEEKEPDHDALLKLAEASILTLRKP
jgi:hypothetical protein